jgi:hypothetical protein
MHTILKAIGFVAEVVSETFSDVKHPLALVLGSPLSPSHVLAAGSDIIHLSMVKHLLKITKKKVTRIHKQLLTSLGYYNAFLTFLGGV